MAKSVKSVSSIAPITVVLTSNNNNATSAAFWIGGGKLVAITSPTLTSATFTFTTCETATGTFEPYRNSGNTLLTTTITAGSRNYYDTNLQTAGLSEYVKIVTAGNEAADRTFTAYVDYSK